MATETIKTGTAAAPSAGPGGAGRQRSVLIDIVRGIAITLVALGHTNQGLIHREWWRGSNFGLALDRYIYSFHMPAFFFVGGIFLYSSIDRRGPGRFVRSRFATILYPYLLMMICFEPIAILGHFTSNPPHSWGEYAVKVATGAASWFLPTIFFMALLALATRRVPTPLLFVLSVVAGYLMLPPHGLATGITFIDRGVGEFPFMVAGIWVGRSVERMDELPLWLTVLGAALSAVVIGVVTQGPYAFAKWVFYPVGLLGTLLLFLVARMLMRLAVGRWAAWVGFASLSIFLLAAYFQWFGRMLLERFGHTTSPVPQLLFATLLAVAAPAWMYHQRERLHIRWIFEWPFFPREKA